jgi:photosystem II stability/assembly factor-like uncharacterized protein
MLLTFIYPNSLAQNTPFSLRDMRLLNPAVGWVSNQRTIYWTSDGGSEWNNVAPPLRSSEEIKDVFFLDTSNGWALLSVWDDAAGAPQLSLASTNDSGATWNMIRISVPDLDPAKMTLGGGGRIDFLDSKRGWMNLDLVSSSNFSHAILLETTDGGKSWNWVPESPGISGSVRFVTTKDGWLAGGPGGAHLYATHDGSRAWQEVSLQAPAQALRSVFPTYDLPTFSDGQHGILPVTYSGPKGSMVAFVVFATKDGGATWASRKVLLLSRELSQGTKLPAAVVDSAVLMAMPSDRTHLVIKSVSPGGMLSERTTELSADTVVLKLSFSDSERGWALTSRGLLATDDGGVSWHDITPSGKNSRSTLSDSSGVTVFPTVASSNLQE